MNNFCSLADEEQSYRTFLQQRVYFGDFMRILTLNLQNFTKKLLFVTFNNLGFKVL